MIASAGPTARRAASSSSTTPITETTTSGGRRQARPQRDLAVEDEQIHAAPTPSAASTQSVTGMRLRGEDFSAGNVAKASRNANDQVDDARLAVVDDAEIQLVGQRRGVPELEQRPGRARSTKM